MKRIFTVILISLISAGSVLADTVFSRDGSRVRFRSDDGAVLELKMCSQSVVRVRYAPDGVMEDERKSYAVGNDDLSPFEVNVNEQAACYEIFTDKLRIRIDRSPLKLQIFDKYQKLLFSDCADRGRSAEGSRKVEYKILRRDEHFFGLGEKTGKLDRRGEQYKMWNSDKPCYSTVEDPLYKSIPFFMSNYHYGIFLDNTYKTEFKFGTESRDWYSFEVPDGEMVYYFIFGSDFKEIIGQYTLLTGKPIMPPKWALGFSQCRGLLTNEKLTYEIARGYRERGIPCDVIYQDIGWTEYLQDFEWRKGNYTNPRKMLSDLDSMGFKVILSQDPVISKANARQWEEADSLGYFVKDVRTGKSYDMPWPWGGDCGVVDFTNPEVAAWWGAYQQKPLDDGAAGFWTDMGEPAWSNEESVERLYMQHHDGMHSEIHNVYGLTWDKVVKEQFELRNPDRRVFQMTRAAYAGLQKYTFGWTGDSGCAEGVTKGWAQMENQIAVLLSAGLGLIPFTTTDISGYCGDIDDYPEMAELYVRWVQMGAFNPISRIHHEGNNAVEPWLFGEDAEKYVKDAISLKYSLLPYIYSYAREAHDTGLPIMRAMFLEYPNDSQTFSTDNQFMFGEELLVAPAVKKNAKKRNVYLPEGEWIDFNDMKTVYDGEQWISVDAPLSRIPMFVRKGSIIPRMPVMDYTRQKAVYPVRFQIFPADEGESAGFSLYEDDGESLGYLRDEFIRTDVSCRSLEKGFEIELGERVGKGYQVPGRRNFIFEVHTDKALRKIAIDGKTVGRTSEEKLTGEAETDFSKAVSSIDRKSGIYLVRIPDDGGKHIITLYE